MKRSTPDTFYVTPSDFDLAAAGKKTASTRLGDRTAIWPVGKRVQLVDNTDWTRNLFVTITYNELMTLADVNDCRARTVGEYDAGGHYADFVSVYPDATRDSLISLVGFYIR